MKLYFVGAHSTGKTTLARYASTTYKLPLIAETARTELAKMERRFDDLRVDVAATTQYQKAVFDAQLRAEHGLTDFVSDRAFFDNLAYLASHANGLRGVLQSRQCREAAAQMRDEVDAGTCRVFYVQPHAALLRSDGFRAEGDLSVPGVFRIDGMVAFMLEMWLPPTSSRRLRYVPIEGCAMRERQRLVDETVSGMSGVRR
jgi:hypothetical protein